MGLGNRDILSFTDIAKQFLRLLIGASFMLRVRFFRHQAIFVDPSIVSAYGE